MARPGEYRWNKARREWELYIPGRGWMLVSEITPEVAEYLAGTEYQKFEDGVQSFGFPGEKPGEENAIWFPQEALAQDYVAEKELEAQFGGPPTGWIGTWPPRRSDGGIDESAARKAISDSAKATEPKETKPSGAFPTSAAARQAAASDPDLAGYQPVRDSGTGQWYLEAPKGAQSAVQQEAARLEQEAALVRAQQPPPQAKPSFDDTILEALLSGNEDKALYFDAFQNRPTRLQALAFAMQYAETPDEFDQLFQLAQGPALDYAETQPVFTQARAKILGSGPQSLGGLATPPTTANLQGQGARQDYVVQQQAQGIFRPQGFFNVPPGPPQERTDEGVRGPTQPLPTLTNEGQQIAYTEAYEQFLAENGRAPNAAEIQGLKEAATFPEATEGPDLSDVPSAEETRAATGGKTIAAPGVAVIPDFVKKAGLTFYNPDKQNQLFDYANELDEILAGVPGKPAFTAPEGFDPDEAKAAKAAQLGVENPFRKKQPQPTFSAPASIFKRKQPQPEPEPTFRRPRYIGAR